MINLAYAIVLVCGVALSTLSAFAPAVQLDDASLRAADAEEVRIFAAGDSQAMSEDDLIKLMAAGTIAHDGLERTVEGTAITGNVGIVMGHETIKPKPNSELAHLYGAATLDRRFTDVFLFENSQWRLLARQSTVIRPTL